MAGGRAGRGDRAGAGGHRPAGDRAATAHGAARRLRAGPYRDLRHRAPPGPRGGVPSATVGAVLARVVHQLRTLAPSVDDRSRTRLAPAPAAELLEELSEDLLSGAGAEGALSRLMRRGMRGRFDGLDALRARLRDRRDRERSALDLQGPLEGVRDRLEAAVDRERWTLSFRAEDDARVREVFLEALPPDVPGKIRELTEYRFVDPEAQRGFGELVGGLGGG